MPPDGTLAERAMAQSPRLLATSPQHSVRRLLLTQSSWRFSVAVARWAAQLTE
jgi:hypothetical protein